jgi:hypothetical protein
MNDHLIVGSAVHKAVESFRKAQIEGYAAEWSEDHRNDVVHLELDAEFDKLVSDAENGYERDGRQLPAPGMVWTKGVMKDNARKLAHKLAEAYFYKPVESDIPNTPKVPLAMIDEPVGIEEEFYVPIPGTDNWHARGRFDMRTKNSLVDLKTAKMRYSQRDMDKKTQPSFIFLHGTKCSKSFCPSSDTTYLSNPRRRIGIHHQGMLPQKAWVPTALLFSAHAGRGLKSSGFMIISSGKFARLSWALRYHAKTPIFAITAELPPPANRGWPIATAFLLTSTDDQRIVSVATAASSVAWPRPQE